MKSNIQKRLNLQMNIILMCLGILCNFIFADSDMVLVQKTSGAPVIDGEQDAIWGSATVNTINKFIIVEGYTSAIASDFSGEFQMMWDTRKLYFFIHVTDEDVRNDNLNFWEGDAIDFFIDGDNSKTSGRYDGEDDVTITIRHDAQNQGDFTILDDGWGFDPYSIIYSIKDWSNGWNLEASIVLYKLQIPATVETVFGFEIHYDDNDSGKRDHTAAWHFGDSDDAWQDASVLGEAMLVDLPPRPKDLGIVLIELDSEILVNTAQSVQVSVMNFGTDSQSNFPIAYQIGSKSPVVETYSGSLAPRSTSKYTFQNYWTPEQLGSVTVIAYSSLTGDENTSNDRKQKTVRIVRQKDVGISIVTAPSKTGVDKPCTISAEITNYGKDSQSNFPLSYKIGNGSWVTETNTRSLACGEKATYSFSKRWTPSSTGGYTVTVRTELSGDQNSDNDSRQKSVEVVNAAYMGSWRGTTSQNRPIFFHVNAEDQIDSISVEMSVNFGSASCTNVFSGGLTVIQNDTFAAGVGAYPAVWNSEGPFVRGHFTSSSSCTGTITEHIVVGGLCGGLIIGTGYTNSSQTWIASQDLIDHVEETVQHPETMRLMQNYPNPFNPSTTIEYSLPRQMSVSLKIFDVRGREVLTLVEDEQPSGDYRMQFNNSDLPNGIYFYRLQTEGCTETRKMIIIE